MTALTSIDAERIATAYHEAGHAAVAVWLGLQLEAVELTPDHPVHSGYCRERVDDPHALCLAVELGDERVIRPQIKVFLAGRAAQQKGGFDHVAGADRYDIEMALKVAAHMVAGRPEAEALISQSLDETRRLLDLPAVWAGVEALAGALLTRGRLQGDDAHRILLDARSRVEGTWAGRTRSDFSCSLPVPCG